VTGGSRKVLDLLRRSPREPSIDFSPIGDIRSLAGALAHARGDKRAGLPPPRNCSQVARRLRGWASDQVGGRL